MNYSEKNPSAEIPKITEEVVALFKEDRLYEAKKLLLEYYDQEREVASKGEPKKVDIERFKVEFIFLKTRDQINWYNSIEELIKEYEELKGCAFELYEDKTYEEICHRLGELRNNSKTV